VPHCAHTWTTVLEDGIAFGFKTALFVPPELLSTALCLIASASMINPVRASGVTLQQIIDGIQDPEQDSPAMLAWCPIRLVQPFKLRSRSIVVNEECFANLTLDHDHTQHTFAIEQLRVHLAPETAHPAIEGHAHELDRYFKAALEPAEMVESFRLAPGEAQSCIVRIKASQQVPSHLPEKAKSVCCVTWQRETLEGVAGGMITTPLTFDWELPKISSGIIAEQISDAVCTCT